MKIEKNKLKNLINEEIERSFDTSDDGFVMAEQIIKQYEQLNAGQKINFLERLFNHINENTDI